MDKTQEAYRRGVAAAEEACAKLKWLHPAGLHDALAREDVPGITPDAPFSAAMALLAMAYAQFMTVGCGITRDMAANFAARTVAPQDSPELAAMQVLCAAIDMQLYFPHTDDTLDPAGVAKFACAAQQGLDRYSMPLCGWRTPTQQALGKAVHSLAQATVALVWARCSEMVMVPEEVPGE